MRVSPADVRMDDLCTRISREVESTFPGSSIELAQNGDMGGCWDEQRVAQALSNLMSNAIKYGAAGTPVRVTLAGNAPDEIVVAVRNRGPEIAPEKLESLFQPLVRGAGDDPTGSNWGWDYLSSVRSPTPMGGRLRWNLPAPARSSASDSREVLTQPVHRQSGR